MTWHPVMNSNCNRWQSAMALREIKHFGTCWLALLPTLTWKVQLNAVRYLKQANRLMRTSPPPPPQWNHLFMFAVWSLTLYLHLWAVDRVMFSHGGGISIAVVSLFHRLISYQSEKKTTTTKNTSVTYPDDIFCIIPHWCFWPWLSFRLFGVSY